MRVTLVVVGEKLPEVELNVFREYWDGIRVKTIHPDAIGEIILVGRGYSKITEGDYNVLVIPQVISKQIMMQILRSVDFMMNFLTLVVRDFEGDYSQVTMAGCLNFEKMKK